MDETTNQNQNPTPDDFKNQIPEPQNEAPITNNLEPQQTMAEPTMVQNQTENEQEIVKEFIEKNVEKIYCSVKGAYPKIDNSDYKPSYSEIVKNNFTNPAIWALVFFGPAYYLYRKMYVPTAILLSILTLILILTSKSNIPLSYLYLIWVILFPWLYGWDIKRKIEKIRKDNPNSSYQEILGIVRQKGGTSFLSSLTVIPALIMMAIILFPFISA